MLPNIYGLGAADLDLSVARKAYAQLRREGQLGLISEEIIQHIYELFVREGDVVVDGGAAVGRHTAPLARRVGASGRVLAFEPVPSHRESLERKVQADAIAGRVLVRMEALSDAAGESEFVTVEGRPGFSGLKDAWAPASLGRTKGRHPTTTIDAALSSLGDRTVTFVKLDLEGGEFNALRGARDTLRRRRPLVAMEFARFRAAQLYGFSRKEFFEFIEQADYNIVDIFGIPFDLDRFGGPPEEEGLYYFLAPEERATELVGALTQWRLAALAASSPAEVGSDDSMQATCRATPAPEVTAIHRLGPHVHVSADVTMAARAAAARLVSDFAHTNLDADEPSLAKAGTFIDEFFDIYWPMREKIDKFSVAGATPMGGALWLFLIARFLKPDHIVECGTWVGSSLHALRAAAPEARFTAYDITLKHLHALDPAVRYVESDWGQDREAAFGERTLAHFDDHIDNGRRIMQAHERGVRHLVFDDAPNLAELHLYRYPGLPTVPMILNKELVDGAVMEWRHGESALHYRHDGKLAAAARAVIEHAVALPSFAPILGFGHGHKYYVRLIGG